LSVCGCSIVEGWVRGTDKPTGELFSYVNLEKRVPTRASAAGDPSHTSEALVALSADFSELYSGM